MKISSLNCRSLKRHYQDILSDNLLLKSDVICLQKTWLEDDEILDSLKISAYDLHLNSSGRGKGIAIYSKKNTIQHEIDIKEENIIWHWYCCSLQIPRWKSWWHEGTSWSIDEPRQTSISDWGLQLLLPGKLLEHYKKIPKRMEGI